MIDCSLFEGKLVQPTHSLFSVAFTICMFPRSAVMNYHKLSAFKQEKCIFSQFWKLKI